MRSKINEVVAVLDGQIIPTEEELEKYKRAFWSTYSTIGSDANLENESKISATEVVLDASYVKMYGHLTDTDYERFDRWVRQEIKDDYKKGMRKLVKIFWSH